MGKFPCASSGLCLEKLSFNNNFDRVGVNCTSLQGGPCESHPCTDNGFCYEGLNDYFCGCKPGWKGKICNEESKWKYEFALQMSMCFFYS